MKQRPQVDGTGENYGTEEERTGIGQGVVNRQEKQEEMRHQWQVFMHSTKELAKMKRKEKQAKEQEKVNAIKRRLQFEEKETKEEEKKNNTEVQREKESRKQKTPVKK